MSLILDSPPHYIPSRYPGEDLPAGSEHPAATTNQAERPQSSAGSVCKDFSHTFISRKDTKSSSWGAVEIIGCVDHIKHPHIYRHETFHQGATERVCEQGCIAEWQAGAVPWSTSTEFDSEKSSPYIMQRIYCLGIFLLFFFFSFLEILHDRKNETCVRC